MTSTLLLKSLILASVFNARLAQAHLITKTSNETKHLLVENQLKKLKTFGLSYFITPSKHHLHFEKDGAQHYLVFQPLLKYFTLNSNGLKNESQKDYLTKVLKLFLK